MGENSEKYGRGRKRNVLSLLCPETSREHKAKLLGRK
jgi:hypothetical protein